MHLLQSIDHQLLLWINHHSSDLLDTLMWYASDRLVWIPLYVFLLVLLLRKIILDQKEEPMLMALCLLMALVAIAGTIGCSDYICSGILKPIVARPRPSHDALAPSLRLVNNYTGGLYGFPSSHAANTTALSVLFLMLYGQGPMHDRRFTKKRDAESENQNLIYISHGYKGPIVPLCWVLLTIYVILNCYSRMYLGVHYPSDILAGIGVGAVMAVCWAQAYKQLLRIEHV